ncbi:hypothetical protein AAC387_Pa10g0911 [Persea americana]
MLYSWRQCSSCERLLQSRHCFIGTLRKYLEVAAYYFFYKDMDIGRASFYGYFEIYFLGRTAPGALCVFIFLLYKLRKRHIWMDTSVEEFLRKRKNINAFVEHSSQIYFPLWIYDQLKNGGEMEMLCAKNEEKGIAKKLIMTALWCIQLKPIDRPSMRRVVEMLEGSAEHLQMPSKPLLFPKEMHDQDHSPRAETAEPSTSNQLGSITNNTEGSNIIELVVD